MRRWRWRTWGTRRARRLRRAGAQEWRRRWVEMMTADAESAAQAPRKERRAA